jgi:hypothetical protein
MMTMGKASRKNAALFPVLALLVCFMTMRIYGIAPMPAIRIGLMGYDGFRLKPCTRQN